MTASAESVDGPAPAYLTFDDGPDPSSTPEVLAALARVDARATFFVLGSRVRQHPDLVEAMVAAGHGVELHGHAHVSHEDLSPAEIERDLEEGLAALAQAGVYPARWRTPYGSTTDATFDVAAARGLALTGWTSDPRDWAGTSASAMLAALDQVLGAHTVVVLHDGVLDEGMRADARETAALVEPLVAVLRGATSGTERPRAQSYRPHPPVFAFHTQEVHYPGVAYPARCLLAGMFVCVLMLAVPALAQAEDNLTPKLADAPPVASVDYPGIQHLHYRYGPIPIQAGQNNIELGNGKVPKPKVNGWITRMSPNLEYVDGTVPPVDVIHLHHAVWFNATHPGVASGNGLAPFFAAGEEKTTFQLPKPFGMRYRVADTWILNYMIHNLTNRPTKVYLTWDLDFLPYNAPGAEQIQEAKPLWMDVRAGQLYPVFDVHRGSGTDGTFTYPDQDPKAYPGGRRRNEFVADHDMLLVATAGHLHPGGLHDDLWLTRPGAQAVPASTREARCAKARARARRASASSREVKRACAKPAVFGDTVHLFKSMADYFEPAGAVSWDVAMTGTQPDWRVQVHAGDTLKINSTYDAQRSSWYESMGIMVVWYADQSGGPDPFGTKVDWPGVINHGHLPENDNHGGDSAGLPDATALPDGPAFGADSAVTIDNFTYSQGDLSVAGPNGAPPVVKAGTPLKFSDNDPNPAYHTITACKQPCNRSVGIAYPLADGPVDFDSGELGTGGPPTADRTTWSTPNDLPPGSYTYFCRIHPFMRGSFRVAQ